MIQRVRSPLISTANITGNLIATSAISGNNITVDAIRGNNIVAGQITGNLLATSAISGNNITVGAIRGNNIVAGTITGNLLANQTITGDDMAPDSIRGNNIVAGQITGNLIAVSSVSSNLLASNLNISLSRVLEQANVNTLGIGGNVNIDVANNTLYYFNANTTANVTFNFRANTQNTFDSITTIGQAMTVAIALKHGSTRHAANLYIDGALQTLYYVGNTRPGSASITNQEINLFSYSVFKTAANSYTVITGNSIFGLG
jgi:hypothetical protein